MPTGTHDNVALKNANSDPFNTRMKDVSVAQDGSILQPLVLTTSHPLDYRTGGSYMMTSKSGLMSAGLAANSPIWNFRWTQSVFVALIRRVRLSMWNTTGFAAGLGEFDLFVARGWAGDDGGGSVLSLAGNQGKLRTSMATSLAAIRQSTTAALTPGTRTLDTSPLDVLTLNASTAANSTNTASNWSFLERPASEHPVCLAQNEGLVVQATVPATGTWYFALGIAWDEVPNYG